jgi:hypothetical protein
MPEAQFNVTYYKSVPMIPSATIKQAFQRISASQLGSVPTGQTRVCALPPP